MAVVYLDRISFLSLFSILWKRMGRSEIFYFDISPRFRLWIRFFKWLGLLKKIPQAADFSLANMFNEDGESQCIEIVEKAQKICHEVTDNEISKSIFLKKMGNYFDYKKIILFLEKSLSEEIYDALLFLYAVGWHTHNRLSDEKQEVVFCLGKRFWSPYLKECADRLGIGLVEYQTGIFAEKGTVNSETPS